MWTALLGLWGFLSDRLSQGHGRRRLERLSADDGESGTGWERGEEDGATVGRLVCSQRSQALGWREEGKNLMKGRGAAAPVEGEDSEMERGASAAA